MVEAAGASLAELLDWALDSLTTVGALFPQDDAPARTATATRRS